MIQEHLYKKKKDESMEISRLPQNLPKNRYRDIMPCKSCPFSDWSLKHESIFKKCKCQAFFYDSSWSFVFDEISCLMFPLGILSCSEACHLVIKVTDLKMSCHFTDDSTRVVLKGSSDGDYINASYVNVSLFSFSLQTSLSVSSKTTLSSEPQTKVGEMFCFSCWLCLWFPVKDWKPLADSCMNCLSFLCFQEWMTPTLSSLEARFAFVLSILHVHCLSSILTSVMSTADDKEHLEIPV